MPIGTITMVLANVGLQIYNNWCNSRQNEQIRQKREEFEQAALERNTQRMWQIMREGQALTLELEEQKHQQRLKDLQGEVDNLLHSMAYSAAINNWPLNVLPIVMKNQALGNLLAQQEETIALHCILTPSNCHSFNISVFPLIEEALETYCNQHWSIASDHPILFYSGAWKSNTHPTEVQIASMRTALSNLPTLLITPEFRPTDGKLVFQVRIWGVGASSSDEFTIPEIEPTKFQRDYISSLDYAHDTELASEVLEDLVPYLQCLIGYMADTYFWSSLGKSPVLPRLLTGGIINTDGMKYLISDSKEYYDGLLTESKEKATGNPFMQANLMSLYDGSAELWDKSKKASMIEGIASLYNKKTFGDSNKSLETHLLEKEYNSRDLQFLKNIHRLIPDLRLRKMLENEIERISHLPLPTFSRNYFPNYLLQEVIVQELDFELVLQSFELYCNNLNIDNQSILIRCINKNEYQFHTYDNSKDLIIYNEEPFNFQYKAQSVKNQRSVLALFQNSKTKDLCCCKERIQYLIEKLNSKILTY